MLNSGTLQQTDDGKQKPSKGKTRHVSETFVQLTGNGSDNGKQNGGIGVAVDNKKLKKQSEIADMPKFAALLNH